MLRDGPIPRFLHGFIEYAAAALFFVAPFVLDFESGGAVAVSITAGVVVLFLAAATEGPTSLINYVPLAAHVVLDYVLAVLLIAMPFIAGFSDETAPTAFFIAIGALHLLITIGTRFKRRDEPKRGGRRSERTDPAVAEPGRERSPSPSDRR
jgi:VIT1/CCC1 family predicted Fe2+/Mn2+ transporter